MINIILYFYYPWTYSNVAEIPLTVTALDGIVVAVLLNSTVKIKSFCSLAASVSPAAGVFPSA